MLAAEDDFDLNGSKLRAGSFIIPNADRVKALINGLKYGAPPHGGIAPGVDRIVMLLADEPNIREVIMFPMNQNAEDMMMNAPNTVRPEQLLELHIRIVEPPAKKPAESA